MLKEYPLKPIGNRWEFVKEADFEDFLWQNLEELLDLTPLKRQYYSQGQFCDLLAIGKNQQLVILELKIIEDRYIVQQLTRYYHALLEEKPFSEQIDYNYPVRLIGVIPSIHKDNLIDLKYNHLNIEFLQFLITQEDQKIYFYVQNQNRQKVSPLLEINPSDTTNDENLPEIPRKLRQILIKCQSEESNGILAIRKQILTFHRKISETVAAGSIIYGLGKSKPIAEFRYDGRRNKPVLFLWLSLAKADSSPSKRFFGRMRIWTDWQTVSALAYIRTGNGIVISEDEYRTFPVKLIPASLLPFAKYTMENTEAIANLDNYDLEFINNIEFRQSYINDKIDSFNQYTWRNTNHFAFHAHGEPLALTITQYIKLLKNNCNRSISDAVFLKSDSLDLSKEFFTLKEMVDFALQERI